MKSEGTPGVQKVATFPNNSLTKSSKIMKITLHISDADYASLLNKTRRLRGSIGLLSPTEGTFNLHAKTGKAVRDYRKLPHGRVSMNEESVRLTLNINLDESSIRPADVIVYESAKASNFVEALTVSKESTKSLKSISK